MAGPRFNVFAIQLRGFDEGTLVGGATAAKAKYQHFMSLDGYYDTFDIYLRHVASCRRVSAAEKESFLQPDEEFARVAQYRGVPLARPGMEVELRSGERGFLTGAVTGGMGFTIAVPRGVFDCHPNSGIVYYADDGSVLYDFRK